MVPVELDFRVIKVLEIARLLEFVFTARHNCDFEEIISPPGVSVSMPTRWG